MNKESNIVTFTDLEKVGLISTLLSLGITIMNFIAMNKVDGMIEDNIITYPLVILVLHISISTLATLVFLFLFVYYSISEGDN